MTDQKIRTTDTRHRLRPVARSPSRYCWRPQPSASYRRAIDGTWMGPGDEWTDPTNWSSIRRCPTAQRRLRQTRRRCRPKQWNHDRQRAIFPHAERGALYDHDQRPGPDQWHRGVQQFDQYADIQYDPATRSSRIPAPPAAAARLSPTSTAAPCYFRIRARPAPASLPTTAAWSSTTPALPAARPSQITLVTNFFTSSTAGTAQITNAAGAALASTTPVRPTPQPSPTTVTSPS